MKKKVVIIVLVTIFILLLGISVISIINYKNKYGLILDTETKEAMYSYIENKYNFTPKIEKIMKIRGHGIVGTGGLIDYYQTDNRFIKVSNQDKIFYLFYNKYKNKFFDSFQYDDIKDYYKGYFKSITGEYPDNVYITNYVLNGGYDIFDINNIDSDILFLNSYFDLKNQSTALEESCDVFIEYFRSVDLSTIKEDDVKKEKTLVGTIKINSYKQNISDMLKYNERFSEYYDNINYSNCKYSYVAYNLYSNFFKYEKFKE